MKKEIITTEQAPKAIGPYSIGTRTGNLVFTSGQIPISPATGDMVGGGIAQETQQVLKNVQAVLEAAGTSLANVMKTTVFLTDMADFAAMNAVYAEFFSQNPPARTTVAVSGLPKGALVEIEAVAIIPE